jgi:ankyrin repeat protein
MLLAGGALVDVPDNNDWTPLHHAVAECYHDKAQLLLDAGASLEAKTAAGETPLDLAYKINVQNSSHRDKMVQLLQETVEERRRRQQEHAAALAEIRRNIEDVILRGEGLSVRSAQLKFRRPKNQGEGNNNE